jgi:hypothetical protein
MFQRNEFSQEMKTKMRKVSQIFWENQKILDVRLGGDESEGKSLESFRIFFFISFISKFSEHEGKSTR